VILKFSSSSKQIHGAERHSRCGRPVEQTEESVTQAAEETMFRHCKKHRKTDDWQYYKFDGRKMEN